MNENVNPITLKGRVVVRQLDESFGNLIKGSSKYEVTHFVGQPLHPVCLIFDKVECQITLIVVFDLRSNLVDVW